MIRRKIKKQLESHFDLKKPSDKSYDFNLMVNEQEYALKIIQVKPNTQLTINSPYVWELQTGKLDGIRFIKRSSERIDLRGFNQHKKRIVLLSSKPFRTLQYLNEADIIDISDKMLIHNIHLAYGVEDLKKL